MKQRDYERNLMESLRLKITTGKTKAVTDKPVADSAPEKPWFEMTDEEREAAGYIKVGPGRWRLMVATGIEVMTAKEARDRRGPVERAPYVRVHGRFQNGRSIYNLHGKQDDIGEPDYIPDYNSEHAEAACKAIGHRYVRDPFTGKGLGPAEFGSSRKEKEFGALTGQRRGEWDENHNKPDPFDTAVQAWERKYGRKYECLMSKEPTKAAQYSIKEESDA